MESQGGEVLDAGKGPSFDIHHETKPLPLNALVAGSHTMGITTNPSYCRYQSQEKSYTNIMKNTIREGGSTALWTADTVDTVDTVDMAYTVDTVYSIETALHC